MNWLTVVLWVVAAVGCLFLLVSVGLFAYSFSPACGNTQPIPLPPPPDDFDQGKADKEAKLIELFGER